MKTPRELLLARHESVVPRLDVIRRAVVAEHVTVPVKGSGAIPTGLVQRLWLELIWPARRSWAGLAAAWMVILGLNLATREAVPVPSAVATSATSIQQWRLARMEQEQLRLELLGVQAASAREPASLPIPGPRSEKPARRSAA